MRELENCDSGLYVATIDNRIVREASRENSFFYPALVAIPLNADVWNNIITCFENPVLRTIKNECAMHQLLLLASIMLGMYVLVDFILDDAGNLH